MARDPELGRVVGSYLLTSVLGVGGMGKVFKATHNTIGKEVAIKLLNREHSMDEESVSRFFREARVANEIKHENIIDTLDFGQTPEGECYLVMELLSGKSLSRAIAENNGGPMPQEKLVHIAMQLCSSLYAAHQRDVIHRDIKSDNVFLVTRAGQKDFVKVLDFGIARINREDASIATSTGTVLGTPLYLSPEQALGKKVGPQSDIYSLGVLLYLMACGAAPFYDANPISLAMMHVMKKPDPLVHRVPSINPKLDAAILRCLEKKLEPRYQTMLELAVALGEACGVDHSPYFGLESSTIKTGPSMVEAKSDPDVGATVSNTTAARTLKRPSYPRLAALGAGVMAAGIAAFFSFAHQDRSVSSRDAAAAISTTLLTPTTRAASTEASKPTQEATSTPSSQEVAMSQPTTKPRGDKSKTKSKQPPTEKATPSIDSFDSALIDPTAEPKKKVTP